jgi:hypothetical protein
MQIVNYTHLSHTEKALFEIFLKNASYEKLQPASVNMWHDDWENHPNTLVYILNKTDRFTTNGSFHIVFDNEKIVACSGVYLSDFSNDIVIAGTRTWINKDYRNKLVSREYLLPKEKKWAIDRGCKAIALCFNDYNKNIISIWNRRRLGENRSSRQPHHLFYNGVNKVDFPVNIQHTKQWVIYERLYKEFDFNWKKLEWK